MTCAYVDCSTPHGDGVLHLGERPLDPDTGRFLDGREPLYVSPQAGAFHQRRLRSAERAANPPPPKPARLHVEPPPISDDTYRALGLTPPRERKKLV